MKKKPPQSKMVSHHNRFLLVFICTAFCSGICIQTATPMIFQQKKHPQVPSSLTNGREILLKAVEAAGGRDRFAQIRNFRITTENVIMQSRTKLDLKVTEIAQLPDKTKQIFQLKAGERVQVLQGHSGWKKVDDNISDLTQSELREMKRGLFRDTINLFKRSESQELNIKYFGKETIAGKSNYVLQIKDNSGEFFNLYIDAATLLISKKTYHGASELRLAVLEEIYSDYREVDGIRLPFHTEVKARGKLFIDAKVVEVKFNLNLADNFFSKN
ncbi:MAG: hypothetical protein ACE5DO_13535 [Desulfobacterales bacterium]